MVRHSKVRNLGLVGLWGVLSACSGSTVSLNKQPTTQDGGGNTTSTGGIENVGGSSNGGASSGGSGVAGGSAAGAGGSSGAGGNSGGAGGSSGSGGGDPFSTGGAPTGVTTSKKLDLLLMVDNSSSMADKQNALSNTVADLVAGLSNVEDLHVGVITSSLGSHGATLCEGTEAADDQGHLIGKRPRGAALNLPQGFYAWTPAEGTDALRTEAQAMVQAVGQDGCGLEAQLEAVYRFLADPYPPESIVLEPCQGGAQCATPQGIDQELLAERAAFLRPDSAVAVVVLTDENDCSIRDSDQFYFAADLAINLPAAATICSVNPNDPCCYSCGLAPPANCPPDPACKNATGNVVYLTPQEDKGNLRCFDQMRRFGIDFLYPVSRYVNALKRPTLCTTSADLAAPAGGCNPRPDSAPAEVRNPLYQNPSGGQGRDPSMVYFLGIVGVPWQDLQAKNDPTGSPYPAGELHYSTPLELQNGGTWSTILGIPNPGNGEPPILPTDPHMLESIDPRPGLPGPTAAFGADPINGHEWNVSMRDDLQYACIFPLAAPGPCTDPSNCDCYQRPETDANPLCETASGYGTTQYFAKGYPSLRELSVVRALGPAGLAASICARNLKDPAAQDYGYRPAMQALATALQRNVQ